MFSFVVTTTPSHKMRMYVNTHLSVDALAQSMIDEMVMEKKRLNVTLAPDIWEKLRAAMYQQNKRANFLIEQALQRYLAVTAGTRTRTLQPPAKGAIAPSATVETPK